MSHIRHKFGLDLLCLPGFLPHLLDLSAKMLSFQYIVRHAYVCHLLASDAENSRFHRKTGEIPAICHQVPYLPAKGIVRGKPIRSALKGVGKNVPDMSAFQRFSLFFPAAFIPKLLPRRGVGIGDSSRPVKHKNHLKRILYGKYAVCLLHNPLRFQSCPPPSGSPLSPVMKKDSKLYTSLCRPSPS